MFLLIIGSLWALMGLGNIIFSEAWQSNSSNMQSVVIIFNFVFFILPGLVVAGIGKLISQKKNLTK